MSDNREFESDEQPATSSPSIPIGILHDDRLLVSEHAPFCGGTQCTCHLDREAIVGELLRPMREGLLTQEEMSRLYTGRQLC